MRLNTGRRSRALAACLGLLAILALAAPGFSRAKPQAPNLSLHVYQRIYTPGKPAQISLSLYNLKSASLSVHAVDIETLVPNTRALDYTDGPQPESLVNRLKRMKLTSPLRTWSAAPKHFYPDSWAEVAVKLPALPSGVYVIQASGKGVTARAWFAVSKRALVVKRSPDLVLAWLVEAAGGQPVAGAPLALYGPKGRMQVALTGSDGMATFKSAPAQGSLWVAARDREPAFSSASPPYQAEPYLAYMYTDRPIYRPGSLVYFRGSVRAVNRGVYSLPGQKTVQVQIKTRGDTVLYDQELPLNQWGGFSGQFQLGPEPPLGSYSVEMALGDFRESASFEVEAYRKPEFDTTVSIAGTHVPGGGTIAVTIGAKYFFGSPVAGAKLKYKVNFSQEGQAVPERLLSAAGLGSDAVAKIEEDFSGQGKLGPDGTLKLSVPTRSVPFNRRMTVSAEVVDLSNRPRSGSADILITAASFRLSLEPEKSACLPGQTAKVLVSARDYDDKPVAVKTTVTLVETLQDREGRYHEQRTSREVTTDPEGRGTVTFQPLRPGSYDLEVWGRDSEGNAVYASSSLQVVTSIPKEEWPSLETTLNQPEYSPGDTALLRVRTSLVGAWCLLTVEGEKLYVSRLEKFPGQDFVLKLPVRKEYMPGVAIRLTLIHDGNLLTSSDDLAVPARDKELTIKISPDHDNYRPGDTATYRVTTLNRQGQGVPAEVGLGVVDQALYAISEDYTPNPYTYFWPPQADRVETDFSLTATYPGGDYKAMAPPSPAYASAPADEAGMPKIGTGAPIPVRRNFADTAYWNASLVTDAQGQGQVSFVLPDNITAWRATARGLSADTQAGQNKNQVKVSMPLMVRLSLPRFYVRQDQAVIAAIVHNYTGSERQVKVALTADGAQVQGNLEQTITVPADGMQRLTWPAVISGQGAQTEAGTRQVRFLVSADGGEGARDAIESTLPVLPDGVSRVEALAGMSGNGTAFTMTLPQHTDPGSASLTLALSPSLAGPIFEALDYLARSPYGCAEQTMDGFLPDIIVTRTLNELGVTRPRPKDLNKYVSNGLQKLLRFQHQDGGWNWWEFDASDPYMTAYVVYGLALARDAGYPLAAGPLPRGMDYLTRALPNQEDRSAACYLLRALVFAGDPKATPPPAAQAAAARLIKESAKLDTFSRASLALALEGMSRRPGAPAAWSQAARSLADELEATALDSGTASHWTANAQGSGSWLDSDVEVTSQVLSALLALKPNSPKIVPAVRWLMAARSGKAWSSTKDTAAAVLALTAYLKQARELSPNATLAVSVNGGPIRTVSFDQSSVFADPVQITIPAAQLKPGENQVNLSQQGSGNLYWSARLGYIIPADSAVPLARGIAVKRTYQVMAQNPVEAGVQPSGSVIQVTTELTASQNYRYALMQEPIPAGCEIIAGDEDQQGPSQDEWYTYYDRREAWDDRLVYYFDYLPKGVSTITYFLRTESPGTYRVRPSTVELMYFPEVRGEGRFVRLQVNEAGEQ